MFAQQAPFALNLKHDVSVIVNIDTSPGSTCVMFDQSLISHPFLFFTDEVDA